MLVENHRKAALRSLNAIKHFNDEIQHFFNLE